MSHYDSSRYGYDKYCKSCGKYLGMGVSRDICTTCEYFKLKEDTLQEATIYLISEIRLWISAHGDDVEEIKEEFKEPIADSHIDVYKVIEDYNDEKLQEKRNNDPMYRIEQLEKRIKKLDESQ